MNMPDKVPELGFYYHYKHDPAGPIENYAYEFLGIGFHTEEARPGEEHFADYRPLYEAYVYKAAKQLGIPCLDHRPLSMWMGDVELNGQMVPRFKKITDEAVIEQLKQIRQQMYG